VNTSHLQVPNRSLFRTHRQGVSHVKHDRTKFKEYRRQSTGHQKKGGGLRFLDAHEIQQRDFNVVPRPLQNNTTQHWRLTNPGGNVYTIVQVSSDCFLDAHEIQTSTSGWSRARSRTTTRSAGASLILAVDLHNPAGEQWPVPRGRSRRGLPGRDPAPIWQQPANLAARRRSARDLVAASREHVLIGRSSCWVAGGHRNRPAPGRVSM
jgi:hypothetical protein